MTRYFTIHNDVTINCGIVQVVQHSNTEQHLWLFWSTKLPYVRPVPFRGQQSAVPHQNNLSLEIQGFVEQEEPGRTREHTFHMGWPTGAQYLFLYSTNMGDSAIKASRSPLFAYELNITPLVRETWQPIPDSGIGWSFNQFEGSPEVNRIGNLVFVKGSNTSELSVLTTFDINGPIGSVELCDLYFSFDVYAAQHNSNFEVTASFGFTPRDSGPFIQRVMKLQHVGPPFCTNYFEGIVVPQPFAGTTSLRQSIFSLDFYSARPCEPFGPDLLNHGLTQLAFAYWPFSPIGPTLPNLAIGNITIGVQNGPMTDVTSEWRKLRIAPFLP